MRINKYIASTGLCSRRKAEEFIERGVVTINGEVAVLSSTVEDEDEVRLNGKVIKAKEDFVVLLFNKPKGVTVRPIKKIKIILSIILTIPKEYSLLVDLIKIALV